MTYLKYFIIFIFIISSGSLQAQPGLKYIRQIDSLGVVNKVLFQSSTFDNPENVLVLYNINYHTDSNGNNIRDGYEIASYYKDKRNIPDENIVAIRTSTNPQVSRAQFDTYYDDGSNIGIKQQVEEILQTKTDINGVPLRSKIKYIVLTKGIPHRIQYLNSKNYFEADYASLDASLALIFNGDYNISWHYRNPYYNQDPQFEGMASFIPEFYTIPGSPRLSFLVTRLDGYSVEEVKAMIDRGLRADLNSGNKTFILDGDQKDYDKMENAALWLNSLGARVYPDPWVDGAENITSITDTVVGIVSHGIYSGMPASYITSVYDFRLADGAVFSSYESLNGASFSDNNNVGQGQIADFIRSGGSGGIGNVYEPFVSNIADESIFFPAYYSGYTFAEAAYMSFSRVDWTAIVVGDPLMRIGGEPSAPASEDLRVISIKPDLLAFSQSTQTTARIVFNQEIDSLDLPVFIVEQTGDTLNSYLYNQTLYLWPGQALPNGIQITFTADEPIYSVSGDSLLLNRYAQFITIPADNQPVAPYIYDAFPAGIDVDITEELLFIFSAAMKPETIFPILSTPVVEQTHHWIDNTVLKVKHPQFLQGTRYSFFLDEHAKSLDDLGLMQNYRLNFETGFNSIVNDIDNDGFNEYALNLNATMLDGYETYADSNGIITTLHDKSDIDGDNQSEFFIKYTQNNFPSFFWNPNAIPFTGYLDACVAVDDDEDGQTEYAFDFNGSGYFTHVYDPGQANPVRAIHFVLLGSVPADGQNNVRPANSLRLTFSKPPKLYNWEEKILTEPLNSISNVYTAKNGTEINIHFAEKFLPESDIKIIIIRDILSVDNEYLAHDYTIQFQTRTEQILPAPRVTSFYPGDSLKISDNSPTVRFVFSNPMQTNLTTPVLIDTTDSEVWTHYWADSSILYLFPLQELQGNKTYAFDLAPQLADREGQQITGKTHFSFTSNEISLDNNRPTILQVLPEPGNTINTQQRIAVIFSEWLSSGQEQWITIQPTQFYNWTAYGSNMFTFSGLPGWKPQSTLDLQLNGALFHDANTNSGYLNYLLNYYVLGDLVERDIDNDGIKEYAADANQNLNDGFESYVDPGGVQTIALFSGDIDKDRFYDFIIADSTGNILLGWYPAVDDSGLVGFCEEIGPHIYDVSVDADNLIEYTVNSDSLTVKPAVPRIRSLTPEDGSDRVPLYEPLTVKFSTSMQAFSVVQAVRFAFAQAGSWSSSQLDSEFRFEPQNGWSPGIIQTVFVDSGYVAENLQAGKDLLTASFRTTDESILPGNLSWQFPAPNDTVHPQSDYYFAFNQAVDTSIQPLFTLMQDFTAINCNNVWLNDTLLRVSATGNLKTGDAVLNSNGSIRFLNTSPIDFTRTTAFFISDTLSLHLVRPLFTVNSVLPLTVHLSLLFNQPLDSAYFDYMALTKTDSNQNVATEFSTRLMNNFLTVVPGHLEYDSRYNLILAASLAGISGHALEEERILSFSTEGLYSPHTHKVSWRQAEDFLILNWPLKESKQNIFELFLMKEMAEKPDTISFQNLYSTSTVSSWLFDLGAFPKQAFIHVRLKNGEHSYWSEPLFANSGSYNTEDLLSLPLTEMIFLDSLRRNQKYLHTISQWSSDNSGWNSATWLEDIEQWNTDLTLSANKGIMGRTDKDGHIVWLQRMPQEINFSEQLQQQARYHSSLNSYEEMPAAELAAILGQATRLAIWDNNQQGWNEAVYDSINGQWINNFQVDFMQPVYVYTNAEFDSLHKVPKSTAEPNDFSSNTKIFYNNIHSIKIYRNGIEKPILVGCGVDTLIHAAYINVGNLDVRQKWLVSFYDKSNRLVDEFSYGIAVAKTNALPLNFSLGTPYPNPFNNEVTIPIAVPTAGKIEIRIFNILGQLINHVQHKTNQAQFYYHKWQGNNASGVYFVQVSFKKETYFTKVLLIK